MEIYCYILIVLHILIIGFELGTGKNPFASIGGMIVYIPVFGRILGWF